MVLTDEATLNVLRPGGYVNNQNYHIWATENPYAYIEKPKYPKRVTVWCGFWSRGVFRPFFFENKQGEAVIVKSETNFCS